MGAHDLSTKNYPSLGYTLVELLVALAVTSIVLTGTYAGFSFFSRQQYTLVSQTEMDRNALRAIDLMQSDIRMAGYKDYSSTYPMASSQPIAIAKTSPGDFTIVFDDYDASGTLYRSLTRYYLASYTPSGGVTRNRLLRQVRKCTDPSSICTVSNSTAISGSDAGEPILDWVSVFNVDGLNQNTSGFFSGQFQALQITLTLASPRKIEGTLKTVTRNFTFVVRARNISLVS